MTRHATRKDPPTHERELIDERGPERRVPRPSVRPERDERSQDPGGVTDVLGEPIVEGTRDVRLGRSRLR